MNRAKHSKLLLFLQNYHEGDKIVRADLAKSMGWTPSSIRTYLGKNMLAPFVKRLDDSYLVALRDGDTITLKEIADAFSQSRPKVIILTKGIVLRGQSGMYSLVERLGNGAIGHVWRTEDRTRAKTHAAKIMLPREDLLATEHIRDVRKRFRKESKNGQQLKHDCVVSYVDYGEHENETPFLVMELAKSSVQQYLDKGIVFPSDKVKEVIWRVANGLQYLHQNECIHRDVKPANILDTERGYVLGDLGIVHWDDMNPQFTSAGTATRASIQLGSWNYMAPEQAMNAGQAVSASDVYALGISWYQMLTNRTLSPHVVGPKRFMPPCDDAKVCEMIAAMLEFEPSARPSIQDVMRFCAR